MNVLRFLGWMRQRGWDVLFYGEPETHMFRQAEAFGVQAIPLCARLRSGDLRTSWRLSRRLREDGVRWLTLHQSADLLTGVAGRMMTGRATRLIYHQHMHIGGDKKDFYHRWLYGQLDAFVTPVQWLADRVLEKTTIDPARLHVIPRGIEIARYTENLPDKAAARARFNLPQDALVIGVIGRLDPKKGQHVAVEALGKLHEAGHRVHLLLIGNPTRDEGNVYAVRVHQLVADLHLADYVHFRPHEEQPQWAYAALDIFALTSKSECYGMVTVEALTSGLPVVATNDGGTVSLIEHEQNGLLVRPLDADDLARAFTRLIEQPELAARLGRTAHERALATFSHHDQCDAWEKLLRGLG